MNVSGDAVSSTNESITSVTGLDREMITHAYDAAVGTFAYYFSCNGQSYGRRRQKKVRLSRTKECGTPRER